MSLDEPSQTNARLASTSAIADVKPSANVTISDTNVRSAANVTVTGEDMKVSVNATVTYATPTLAGPVMETVPGVAVEAKPSLANVVTTVMKTTTAVTTVDAKPTLADLIAAIDAADLAPRAKAERKSALRTIGRAVGRPLETIPADPRWLSQKLAKISPATLGIRKPAWANARSLLRSSLRLRNNLMPGRSTAPLSPQWQALADALPNKASRYRVSRLLHFLSRRSVYPADVHIDHLETFAGELQTASITRDPAAVLRETAWAWNSARSRVVGWPDVAFAVETRKRTWTLPWDAFPASLRSDAKAYLDRLAGNDLNSELAFRPARPSTLETREREIRAFASALVLSGRSAGSLCSLKDLVEIGAFKQGLRYFLNRNANKSTSTQIENLARFLKAIARHWAQSPDAELTEMAQIVRRLAVDRSGMTAKNRQRLAQFDDPQNVQAFLSLPGRLMREADSRKRSRRTAVLAQIATAIEILTVFPIRMKTLAQLDVGHIIRPSRGREASHLLVPGEIVKNGMDLECMLPPRTIKLLDRYLQVYRPLIAHEECSALFPGRDGRCAKAQGTLFIQIKSTVSKRAGLVFNPHLVRHLAAKLHLETRPGEYGTVSQVLGHKSERTTRRAYTGTETAAAIKHFDQTIEKLRGGAMEVDAIVSVRRGKK